MGCHVEWGHSAKAEVAMPLQRMDLWHALFGSAKVLLVWGNWCREYVRQHVISLVWEPGPLGVLGVSAACLQHVYRAKLVE